MRFTVITEHEKLLPFYVLGIGVQDNQEHIIRPHGFPTYQWTFCTKGRGVFVIDHKSYTIEEGMGFYFSPQVPHDYYAIEEPWEMHWVTFDGSYMPSLLRAFHLGPWEIFSMDTGMAFYNRIYEELLSDNLDKLIRSSSILYDLLIHMKDGVIQESSHGIKQAKLQPVIQYMETHLSKDISLETLANLIHVTTHHLCKLFKSAFGMSPIQYLIRLRLQLAKELLLQSPEMKIQDIAVAVGYQDTSYFCTIFKKQEKITPLAFRRLHII